MLCRLERLLFCLCILVLSCNLTRADSISDYPIVFVTAVPNPADFGTMAATFGNHVASPTQAYRGGDLWIRYPDGTLKNLTEAAGLGTNGFQGANAIAVRDPAVHWDGTKVVFSMVVGNPTQQFQLTTSRWQLYEITGLGLAETPQVTKVPHQPLEYNNIAPVYASDDSIIFASDRPRDDSVFATYPQRDEYESSPVVSGLWKLNLQNAQLQLLDHSPSGDFNPIIDSYGRVIFTRWDHLQRDQQNIGASFGAFNYESETSSLKLQSALETFPEPRSMQDPAYQSHINLFTINQFFPWMMNQDGTDLETVNHIGRQEIGVYIERSFNDDPNVQEYYGQYTTGANQNEFNIFLHIKESPTQPGLYYGTRCQEFGTHSAGQLLTLNGAPGVNPDAMVVNYLTHPETAGSTDMPSMNHTGLYRDPLPLANGGLIASHSSDTRQDQNQGSSTAPISRYTFRLKTITQNGQYFVAGSNLTPGISKSVQFWSPDQQVSYSGLLWELMPVELKARPRPQMPLPVVPAIEQAVFSSAGVSLAAMQNYLRDNNLALVVSRNVTARDRNDRQQPTNLRVPGTSTESIPHGGKVYDVSLLQFYQGDLIRGYNNGNQSGRRVLAQRMHSVPEGLNLAGSLPGSVTVASDGSMAAIVPARRALSWQLTSPEGTPVVRERYWVTFQPGEVRVCASCHGINTADHLGNPPPANSPLALAQLLAQFKNLPLPSPSAAPTISSSPGGPSSGEYSLRVLAGAKGKRGFRFQLGSRGGLTGEKLSITLKLNKLTCATPLVVNGGANETLLPARVPGAARVGIKFSMTNSSGAVVGSASLKVPGLLRKPSKAILQKLCAQLLKQLSA